MQGLRELQKIGKSIRKLSVDIEKLASMMSDIIELLKIVQISREEVLLKLHELAARLESRVESDHVPSTDDDIRRYIKATEIMRDALITYNDKVCKGNTIMRIRGPVMEYMMASLLKEYKEQKLSSKRLEEQIKNLVSEFSETHAMLYDLTEKQLPVARERAHKQMDQYTEHLQSKLPSGHVVVVVASDPQTDESGWMPPTKIPRLSEDEYAVSDMFMNVIIKKVIQKLCAQFQENIDRLKKERDEKEGCTAESQPSTSSGSNTGNEI